MLQNLFLRDPLLEAAKLQKHVKGRKEICLAETKKRTLVVISLKKLESSEISHLNLVNKRYQRIWINI